MELRGSQFVSRKLYDILEWSGSTEETRKLHHERAIHYEIRQTAITKLRKPSSEIFMAGSYFEGSTTMGMCSDIDIILCTTSKRVYEFVSDDMDGVTSFLISRDRCTKPGYVMLQSVRGHEPETVLHRDPRLKESVNNQGEICFKHVVVDGLNKHGPAMNVPGDMVQKEIDYVYAFNSKSIPNFARQWIDRGKIYNWPCAEQISDLEKMGCFYVGVGHPESNEARKEREWRISFTFQERQLMHDLNPTQHKCCILLKMVKKNIIQETIGQSITSYHCKTALLYTIENSPCDFWVPENLVKCLRSCIFRLLVWTIRGYCPNYFIPGENMLDKTESRNKLHRIGRVLFQILQSGFTFLLKLTADHVGHVLADSIFGKAQEYDAFILYKQKMSFEFEIYNSIIDYTLQDRNKLLQVIKELPPDTVSATVLQMYFDAYKEHYCSVTKVKLHTPTVVSNAFDTLKQFINLLTAQQLALLLCHSIDDGVNIEPPQLSDVVLFANDGRRWDVLSAGLILATVYLRFGMLEECINELTSIRLDPWVTSVCNCRRRVICADVCSLELVRHTLMTRMSPETFRLTYAATCIAFLPNQKDLVHRALHLEMYRAFGETIGNGEEKLWHDCILIDTKIYFYFLKYLLYTQLRDTTRKQEAIRGFQNVMEEDMNLGHRETAYNVLSWMYKEENRIAEAFSCLCESVKVQPKHNAAKWHLALLLWDLQLST